MFRRPFCLTFPVLLACAGAAPAQNMLDLIPGDAMATVAIRNLNDLKKKGDQFIKDTEMQVPLRPSQLFEEIYKYLGIQGGIDENGAAAIVLVNEKVVGAPLGTRAGLDEYFVLAVPCSDRDKVAASFGIEKGTLKPDKLIRCNHNRWFGKFCYARGQHLFLGNLDKSVLSVARGRTAGADLSAAQRKSLGGADIAIQIGTRAWGDAWESGIRDLRKRTPRDGTEAERRTAREFADTLGEARFVVGGVRLDGGLGFNVVTVFPRDGKVSRKFLTTLRGGDGASALNGLPAGPAVAAWATRGDGSRNAVVAQIFFQFLLRDLLEVNKIVASADRPALIGLFADIWQRLRGSRFALYKTADERKLGLFSAVGILDTEDAQKFIDELKQLARFGNPEGLDLTSPAVRDANRAEIEKLVANLGGRRFALRNSATTKLLLVGEPALPFLEKALKDKDLEVSRRAERIKREIVQAAEARRKVILSRDLPRLVKPSFVFLPRGKDVGGVRVSVVGVKLSKQDAAYAPQLRQLLGPEWNKVRLVAHGKQVVVLVGSDVPLLSAAIANLKEGKPGLAEAPALKEFARRSDAGRKMELHVSVQAGMALWTAADLEKPGTIKAGSALTSVALTVEPDRLQLDVWIPASEFKVLNKTRGW